jgi:cell division protein FtsN
VGLATGLFIALGVHLHHTGSDGTSGSDGLDALFGAEQGTANGGDEVPAEPAVTDDQKPTFEFYRLLPEQEVAVPDNEPGPLRETPPAAAENSPVPTVDPPVATATEPDETGERYLLQAGSFRDHADADRLKASLALLGIEASIQRVRLSGGETWHRVRIGPFSDRQALNGVRQRLQENSVETILLKADG